MNTDLDLAKLKVLAAAVTPGPWQVAGTRFKWRETVSNQVLDSHMVGPDGDAVCLVFYTPKHHAEQLANAAFIAAAREAVPALIARVERAEAAMRRISDTTKPARSFNTWSELSAFVLELQTIARAALKDGDAMADDPINLRAPTLEERRAQERAQPTTPLRKLDWADGYELGARRERLTRERDGARESLQQAKLCMAASLLNRSQETWRKTGEHLDAALRALEENSNG